MIGSSPWEAKASTACAANSPVLTPRDGATAIGKLRSKFAFATRLS
jgi:hypothetical protein